MELVKSIDLKDRLQNCKTGTTVFCHSPNDNEAAIIRNVLDSFWNHTAVVFWINGELFIVEAMINDVIRPKRFDLWYLDRIEDEFGISQCEVPDHMITNHFGSKPTKYDLASVLLYIGFYQKSGKWLGRTGEKASEKMFCFEFSAEVRGLPEWWKIVPKLFPA